MNSIRPNRKPLSSSSLNLNAPESLEPRMVLDSTVVFNELFYHPLDNSPQVEFVEFHNQNAVDVDISQWRIEDGIEFTFPQGTIVPGGGYVVVAADPTAFAPQPEGAILGPFNGRLSNGGERLTLVDRNDRRIDFIEYSDGGDWTAAADGTGVSLAKAVEDTTSQPARNWTSSVQVGGTPGRANFPQDLTPPADTIQTLVSLNSEWKFHDGGSDLGTTWRNVAFNDASWSGTGSNGPYYAGNAKLVGATADVLPVASATASTFLIGHDPINSANGNGLSGTAHVSQPASGTMWMSTGTFFGFEPDTNPEITYDLGEERSIDLMKVWNFNHVESASCCLNRGIAVADILVAGEDGVFQLLIDNQTFDQAPGENTDFSQEIALGGVTARYVKIDVDTTNGVANFGDPLNFVGLSEVQFLTRPPAGDTELAVGPNTHYFRKAFNFNQDPSRTSLTMELLVDDGAVVYLNGQEIYRHNMPVGPVTFASHALFEIGDAGQEGPIVIPANALQQGQNVLAVETHQANAANPDMVFGLELTAVTSHPAPVDVSDVPVRIHEIASVTGASPFIEVKNVSGEPLSLNELEVRYGSQRKPLAASGSLAANALHVVLLNPAPQLGEVVSITTADGQLVYDAVAADSRSLGRHPDFHRLLFTSADSPNAENQFALQSDVVINEIMYHHRPQVAVPDTPPTLERTVVVPLGATWRFNQANQDLGPNWHQTSHAIGSDWESGPGLLGFDTGTFPAPGIQTTLADPRVLNTITLYFETDINFSAEQWSAFDQFELRHVIDDGAVFYVNGTEIARFNMADGPIDASTTSSASVNNASLSDAITIPKSAFRQGQNRISVEVHQRTASSNDVMFGMELVAGSEIAPGIPGSPYHDNDEEWIELFNRGDQAIDLSNWELADAVSMRVDAGTTIEPKEYRLAVRDYDAFVAKYPELTSLVIGEYSGSLANQTERILLYDAAGNPADQVRYYQDGQWPSAADGGGSSLELRDPYADNGVGLAWAASDEGARSEWQTYTYQGIAKPSAIGPDGQWEEFVIGMLDAGEVLLDDISVIANPNSSPEELIKNGSFEADSVGSEGASWRLIGNHRHSEVIVDPDDPNNQVLRFVATSATEHMHNHGETTLNDRIRNGVEYQISYKAKWITGSNLLHSRLYFNRLAQATPIAQPEKHGTPGRVNSQFETNIGPTYQGFLHQPAVPAANEPITVTVDAWDANDVQDVMLWYSVEGDSWQSTDMLLSSGTKYVGTIPGQDRGRIVQFYVEGTDGLGQKSTFPREGRDSRALFQIEDGKAADTGLNNLRLIVRPDDAQHLHSTIELMSNDATGTTLIYNESEIFYDTTLRLSGSQRARPYQPRLAFSVAFPSDHLFRGLQSRITLDRSESTGYGQREHIYHQGAAHAGGLPSEYNDLFQIITPRSEHTGAAEAQMTRYSDIFLDEQYDNGADGQLYEYELTYYPQQTDDRTPEGRKLPQPDGVEGVPIADIGETKEDYRWAFLNRNNRAEDDYTQLMAFSKIMGLTGSAFTSQIGDVIDVDQWLRAFAFSVITGHGDNYGADGSQHNLQLYVRPEDGKVLFFPHDLDAFFQTTRALVGNNDLRKMLTVPEWEHMYYGHVHDMIQTTFNEQYMTHWTDLYRELIPSQRFDRHLTELVRRSDYLIGQIERQASPLDFSITTADSSVNTPTVTIAGNGWVNVRELRLAGSDVPLSVEWTDVAAWSTEIPLALGANQIQIEAYDFQGQLIGADAVTVTTSVANPVQDAIRISEINYHPHVPTDQELASVPGLTDESFEFVELVNVSDAPVNLLGVQFSQGVEFVFPSMILGANEVGVIVRNEGAFVARYGDQVRILGEFARGQLSNSGEQLTLVDVAGEQIASVDYTESDPWSEAADGVGATLEWSVSSGNSAANAKPNQWRSSVSMGGNPGSVDRLASRGIVINEVISNGAANQPDAIELFNSTDESINISGWFLSDSGDNLFKFAVPAGTVVPANGYVVFDETDFNADPNLSTSFALGAGGDDVWLTRADDENNVWFEDHVRFPALDLGQSWGRPTPSSNRSLPLAGVTLGAANAGVAVGPVVLSEIAYRPGNPSAAALAIDPTIGSADLQFVELWNASGQAVNLANWELTGTLQYAFDSLVLNGGESIVLLSFDPNDGANAIRTAAFRSHYGLRESVRMIGGVDGTVSADTTGGNGLARLWMPMNENANRLLLSDEAFYDNVAPWPSSANGSSLQRTNANANGNDAVNWQASLASPGQHATASADFNQDGRIDVADIDLLCAAIQAGDNSLDLNGDSIMSQSDMDVLIKGVLRTSYGDVNLDGVFNSNDLVTIFQQGEYEDGIAGNSTWADGDWNCDGEFSTADLVIAFQDGGYVAAAKKNRS